MPRATLALPASPPLRSTPTRPLRWVCRASRRAPPTQRRPPSHSPPSRVRCSSVRWTGARGRVHARSTRSRCRPSPRARTRWWCASTTRRARPTTPTRRPSAGWWTPLRRWPLVPPRVRQTPPATRTQASASPVSPTRSPSAASLAAPGSPAPTRSPTRVWLTARTCLRCAALMPPATPAQRRRCAGPLTPLRPQAAP